MLGYVVLICCDRLAGALGCTNAIHNIIDEICRKARPSFSMVLQRMTLVLNVKTKKNRVILCNTLKEEGRAFLNIGKYIPIVFNQPSLFSSIIQLIAD